MSGARQGMLDALGRSGVVAIGLWCFAVAGAISYLAPLARENARLRAGGAVVPAVVVVAEGEASAPAAPVRLRDLARLSVLAEQQGLKVEQRRFEDDGGKLRGRIAVSGVYPATRAWLRTMAATPPGLRIDRLRIERTADDAAPPRTLLEFTLLPGAPAAPAGAPPAAPGRDRDLFAAPAGKTARASAAVPTEDVPAAGAKLPFTYGGRFVAAGSETFLLLDGDAVHRVRPGETVADTPYRLDRALPGALHFTVLPGSRTLTLPTEESAP